MPTCPPIFLAYNDASSVLEIVIWIVAGVIWFLSQVAAAKRKKARKAQRSAEGGTSAAPSGGGEAPSPAELAEIFRRLGADIPGTPRPHPRPPPSPRPPPAAATSFARRPSQQNVKKPASGRVQPEVARRLARARQEAEQAAQRAEAARLALDAVRPGIQVQSHAEDARALSAATKHTGAILPRLYAMNLRLAPLPGVPMPAFDRRPDTNRAHRIKLHGRRQVRDALIAQSFLQPSKSAWR